MAVERIPQSVTKRFLLKAYLSSDHTTAATGKTIAIVLSQNGAAFGNPSAGATTAMEIGQGWYYFDASTTDTGTAGPLIVRGTASGVDDVERTYHVVNAHNAGFDGVPNAAAEASGGLATLSAAQASNGTIQANVHRWLTGTPNALQSGRIDSYLGAVASGVIAAASFASGALDAVWSTASRTLTAFSDSSGITTLLARLTSTRAGNLDNLDATVSSRSTYAGADTAGTTTLLARIAAALTITSGKVDVNDKSGFSLTAAYDAAKTAAQAGEPASALAAAGVTTTVTGRIDAAISSRSSHTAADVATQVTTDHGSGSYVRNTEPLDASAIRTAIGLASANLDAQLAALATIAAADPAGVTTLLGRLTSARATLLDNLARLDATISSVVAAIPSAAGNAGGLLDAADAVETGLTVRQALRLVTAALAGTVTGMDENAPVFKNALANSKARITATTDDDGNRLTVTLDAA